MKLSNKVLIKLLVPELDSTFDVFIPVNEVIWKITKMLVKSVSDLSNAEIEGNKNFILINKITTRIYNSNEIVINTDIRNGTELILISNKEL